METIFPENIKRLFPETSTSFFLFGPRGTGKSTWLRQRFPGALYLDLLSPDIFREYASKPERLEALINGNPGKSPVVIDEIQRIPEMLPVVHQMIERKRGLQFVLTGSSSRKLKRSGSDLLAGRLLIRTAHPFLAAEIGRSFDLAAALERGLLPLVVAAEKPVETLKAYAALYVREEVQMEGLVRNVGNFSRFLEAMSFSHSAQLNTAAVARECNVERKTVEGYIGILEDLLLCFRLPVFTRRAQRRLVAHQKFYYCDAGVFRSLRPSGPLDRPEEIAGAALEGLVAQHIRAWNAYSGDRNQLFYWRTKAGTEVDFIVYGPECFTAIEVKNARKIFPKDVRGLAAFKQDYPEAAALLLYCGLERIKIKDVLCLPCEEFLAKLVPGKPMETE